MGPRDNYVYFANVSFAAVRCEEPALGPNVSYSQAMTDFDAGDLVYLFTLKYTCDVGTERVAGDLVRECLHDKTWSGDASLCQGTVAH